MADDVMECATPGQAAYETYMRARFGPDTPHPASRAAQITPWAWLGTHEHRAWEASAAAVLAWHGVEAGDAI